MRKSELEKSGHSKNNVFISYSFLVRVNMYMYTDEIMTVEREREKDREK